MHIGEGEGNVLSTSSFMVIGSSFDCSFAALALHFSLFAHPWYDCAYLGEKDCERVPILRGIHVLLLRENICSSSRALHERMRYSTSLRSTYGTNFSESLSYTSKVRNTAAEIALYVYRWSTVGSYTMSCHRISAATLLLAGNLKLICSAKRSCIIVLYFCTHINIPFIPLRISWSRSFLPFALV